MDKDQLINLVLDVYKAKKEAKDYLDFFENPDIDKRMEKARADIQKAIIRVKRGLLKPRMLVVKDAIKSISSLSPGEEYIADIMVYAFNEFCIGAMFGRMKDATLRSVVKLMNDTVIFADKNGLSASVLPRMQATIQSLKTDYIYRREFKRIIEDSFAVAIENCGRQIYLS